MDKLIKCCFCGKEMPFRESNNPDPADTRIGSRCCLDCNYDIVLPARSMINTLIKGKLSGKNFDCVEVPDFSCLKAIVSGKITIQHGVKYVYDPDSVCDWHQIID